MPSEPELKVIHGEFLILLQKFHELCISNNIKYSLLGGTLLGAIREKGFIPWDDDVDVVFIRPEYEKFSAVLQKIKLGREIRFESLERERACKLIMEREGKPTVWIDVQVYDYISEKPLSKKIKICGTCFFAGFLRKHREELFKAKLGGWKYAAYHIAFLLGRPFPLKFRFQMWNAFCKKWFCGTRKLIYLSNSTYRGVQIISPVKIMEDYMLVPFENIKLMVTKNYRGILVPLYGEDYMTPKRYEEDVKVHEINRKLV